MLKTLRLKYLLISTALLYTTPQFGLDFEKMDTEVLTGMLALRQIDPFLFMLLKCDRISPAEAERAVAERIRTGEKFKTYANRPANSDSYCWYSDWRSMVHYLEKRHLGKGILDSEGGLHISIDHLNVANALKRKGAGCEKFRELIEAKKKQDDEEAKRQEQAKRLQLLAELEVIKKPAE